MCIRKHALLKAFQPKLNHCENRSDTTCYDGDDVCRGSRTKLQQYLKHWDQAFYDMGITTSNTSGLAIGIAASADPLYWQHRGCKKVDS
eukprot:gene6904-30879_t